MGARQLDLLACTLFAALALGTLGGRWVTRVGLAMVGAWVGIAASAFLQQEFWFVAWATVATYVSYFLGDISRLSGAGRLGMIAFFVGAGLRVHMSASAVDVQHAKLRTEHVSQVSCMWAWHVLSGPCPRIQERWSLSQYMYSK